MFDNDTMRAFRAAAFRWFGTICVAVTVVVVLEARPAFAVIAWDGEHGTQWWFDPVNWNYNANSNVNLPPGDAMIATDALISIGTAVLPGGKGVVYDPANDPFFAAATALPFPPTYGPQVIKDLYISRATTQSNQLTVAGDLEIFLGNFIVGRSSGQVGVGALGKVVQERGKVLVTATSLDLANTDLVNPDGYGNGIYDYRGGTLDVSRDAGLGLRVGNGSSIGAGGQGRFIMHNPTTGGYVRAFSVTFANNVGPDGDGVTRGVGIAEFHLENGGVRPMQINGDLRITNGNVTESDSSPGVRSARLDLVLDAAPATVGGIPQNLGLFDVDISTTDPVTGSIVGTGSLGPVFSSADASKVYTEGSTVSAIFGTTKYNWTISYHGNITETDLNNSIVGSITGASTGKDVVLIGKSIEAVPEPATVALAAIGVLGTSLFHRRRRTFRAAAILLFAMTLQVLCGPGTSYAAAPEKSVGWDTVPGILSQIVPPKYPDRDFPVADFGAKGDGQTDCKPALDKAIDACHEAGGGRVVVPAGKWLVKGPIHLLSNVNLHVAANATVLFGTEQADYLPNVFTRFEGNEAMNYSPFLYAYEQENIAITGEGTFDGQASNKVWWPWKGSGNKDANALRQMGEDNVPPRERLFGDGHELRPNFVQPYKCKNVLIEGVTFTNSPMWILNPVLCDNVTVRGVTVRSHGPNNDGCDPESCRNVLIEKCLFDTGDDCIAIKSGRNADGRRIGIPSENIIIRNCQMKDGHGGVVLGSEMSGGIRNVYVEDCQMDSPNLDRAIRLKSNTKRGGYLEDLYVRNIQVGQVADAVIRINLNYDKDRGDYNPRVQNIFIKGVTSQKSKYPLYFVGLDDEKIRNVVIEDCTFRDAQKPSVIENVEEITLKNFHLLPSGGFDNN